MRLSLASLDRLVSIISEGGGCVSCSEAASQLFATPRPTEGLARSVLGPLVDEDARLVWHGSSIALADIESTALAEARFVVFDLETTGFAARSARICEIGAARVHRFEVGATFETLVAPGVPSPNQTEHSAPRSDAELARAPRIGLAMRRFVAFAGDDVLVAHNARFDVGFVDRALERTTGTRFSGTVIDTLALARNLLRGRVESLSLASLAFFFGVSATPCHRALPDALATAEVFLRLVGLARERGALTVAELEQLSATKLTPARSR
jgi:DNA polymerase III epsilon subunit family exonuclease